MFTIEEIALATGGTVLGSAEGRVSAVSTDSRLVGCEELFVPLKGERLDGHNFIAAASARGAKVFLAASEWVHGNPLPAGSTIVAVDDTLRALGDLAAFHRRRFRIPVVGVTGSNGKTTVKEMLASILSLTGKGLKTSGNFNNLVGLPKMLFQLSDRDGWAVLEMGMSEPGEIDRLAEIAAPGIGIITNAYAAHLESMGSVEAVARAKGELFMRLPAGGCAVYNADDPLVRLLPSPAGVKRLSFGLHGGDISAGNMDKPGRQGSKFILNLSGTEFPVTLKALGIHNVSNALAAAAAASTLGIDPELIVRGLEQFTPYDRRFNLEELDGIFLIDDSYNANPASMAAAMITLVEIRGEGRAMAVLGDMLELGGAAKEAHMELGKLAATCVERLYLLGAMAETVASGARKGGLAEGNILVAQSHDEILADLRGCVKTGDFILVKGSRGMGMDKVADGLRREFAAPAAKGGGA